MRVRLLRNVKFQGKHRLAGEIVENGDVLVEENIAVEIKETPVETPVVEDTVEETVETPETDENVEAKEDKKKSAPATPGIQSEDGEVSEPGKPSNPENDVDTNKEKDSEPVVKNTDNKDTAGKIDDVLSKLADLK